VTEEQVKLMGPVTGFEVGSLPIAKKMLISLCGTLGHSSRSWGDCLFIFCIYLFIELFMVYLTTLSVTDFVASSDSAVADC
jgi:hypothetical protein